MSDSSVVLWIREPGRRKQPVSPDKPGELLDPASVQSWDTVQCPDEDDGWPPRLLSHLVALVEAEPVEDGVAHAGEALVLAVLERDRGTAGQELRSIVLDCTPAIGAAILRLLGRIEAPLDAAWRKGLIRDALRHRDPSIRDAAVQAVEVWRDESLQAVLRAHLDPLPWLGDYVKRVLQDLARK